MPSVNNYGFIKSTDDLKRLVDALARTDKPIGFDIETGYYGLDRDKASVQPHNSDALIAGFSLTVDPKWGRYVPLNHEYGPNLPEEEVWDIVRPVLEQPRVVAHNAKFEKRFMRTVDIELGILGDTMLQAYVLAEYRQVGLKYLVSEIFGHDMATFASLFPGTTASALKRARFNMVEVTPDTVEYACEDAAWCLALFRVFTAKLATEPKLRGVYDLEMKVMDILCDMEDWGVAVDWTAIESAQAKSEPFLYHLENELRGKLGEMVGKDLSGFNFGSSPQLRELLFTDLGLKPAKTTPKGAASTDSISLTKLAKKHDPVKLILELREVQNLSKRFNAWLDVDPQKVRTRGSDDKTHANYSQTIVPTGRFSASDPAIQQLPKKWKWTLEDGEEFSGNFRDFLIPSSGRYFIGFDFSQIELRVIAGLAQEKMLLDAFNNGDDVHAITAAMMLGKRLEDVDPETDRPVGKTMNFALIYGMGVDSLAARLGIPKDEAQTLYDNYFAGFTSITNWMNKAKRDGKQNGYTESWIGRRCKVWELLESDYKLYSKAERIMGNYPVQGGAADYMKIAMVRCKNVLMEKGWWGTKVFLLMNQHDALVFEADEDLDPHEVMALLRPEVEFPVSIFPKIQSDWEFGYHYGSCWKFYDDTDIERDASGHWKPVAEESAEIAEAEEYLTTAGVAARQNEERIVERLAEESETQTSLVLGRTVIVEVEDMPTAESYRRFKEFLKSRPGDNFVTFRTPAGEVSPINKTCGVTIEDAARVSMILGGARVAYPSDEVDLDSLAEGLTL